jgi:hypothetical protein
MQAALQTRGYETGQVLYMALELGQCKWKLGFSDGTKLCCQTVAGGDVEAVLREIARALVGWGGGGTGVEGRALTGGGAVSGSGPAD